MGLRKQIAVIISVVLAFVLTYGAVFGTVTVRYIDRRSPELKSRSVEVSQYLPFDEASGIVKSDHYEKLEGDLPVVDGGAALFPLYSAFVNAIYPPESVSYDGKDFAPESAMQFTNTIGAYKSVVDGTADVVFCGGPSQEQLRYAEEKGVTLKLVPIGIEAFVFIVRSDNPVDNLSTGQVRDIYSGRITRWSEVGGDSSFIDTVIRNKGSGSHTMMLSFMGDRKIRKNIPGAIGGRAIGYSFRYYVSNLTDARSAGSNGLGIKMLSLDGVYPDAESIANGSYPVAGHFYAVYNEANGNENVGRLIDFVLSDEGQKIVEATGYVPIGSAD
ncbi:MAG: substrate-binding domain-containing protein [Clostridia bacterium]|nr:substrate-binding domain-containing protein [Clostridia bacterium]